MARGDSFGENFASLKYGRDRNLTNFSYLGNRPPKYITGCYYLPLGYYQKDGAYTTTANRCMYVPLPVWEAKTFAGASIYNSGAGDNGEKFRIMVFRDDGAIGGPGTLEKDFGEITLTAAAALRTLSSSWSATPGMYWIAVWGDSVSTMETMSPYAFWTAAGSMSGAIPSHYLGMFTAPTTGGSVATMAAGHYVDTAYGAAPSTAVAPTASFTTTPGTSAGVGGIVAVWLKG